MVHRKENVGNLQSAWAEPYDQRYSTILSRTLSSSQTFFMTLNLVLGIGSFQNITYAVSVAGVVGAVLAVVLVGLVVCCVMESLSEMITLYPIPNAMVEFVHSFVDREMGHVIGVSYWLSYAMFFAAFLVSAVNIISSTVDIPGNIRVVIAVSIFGGLVALNLVRVRTFGYLELTTGAIKLGLGVAGIAFFVATSLRLNSTAEARSTFGSNGYSTKSDTQAICTALSLAVYPFIGIEGMATMSFETFNPAKGLKWTRYVSYIVLVIYLLLTAVIGINNRYYQADPPIYNDQGLGGIVPVPIWIDSKPYNASATTDFVVSAKYDARVLNGFYAFIAISAGNTALYVASRTLFGMVRRPVHNIYRPVGIVIQRIGQVTRMTRAPTQAVLVSAFMFLWATLLVARLSRGEHFDVVQTLVSMAISTCVVIWASQCLAYIRYWQWRKKFEIGVDPIAFPSDRPSHLVSHPWRLYAAIFGLAGCLFLAIVCNGSSLWSNPTDFSAKICGAYLSIVIMVSTWLLLKLTRFVVEPRDNFELYVSIWDRTTYKQTILRLQNLVNPADYAVEDKAATSVNTWVSNSAPQSPVDSPKAIVQIDHGSRSCTQSSGETNSEIEPQISYILDPGTIDQKPGLTFPVYKSSQSSSQDGTRHVSQTDIRNNVKASEPTPTRFAPITEQSEELGA